MPGSRRCAGTRPRSRAAARRRRRRRPRPGRHASRSPSRSASVPDGDRVERQRRQANDVDPHVVDTRRRPEDRSGRGRPPRRPRCDHGGDRRDRARSQRSLFALLFTFAPPRGHGAATPSPYDPRRVTDPFTVPGGNTQMRRSFVRRCGLVLAALALPVLAIGTGATAAPKTNKLASATLNGDGSTFQLGLQPGGDRRLQAGAEGGDDQLPGQRLRAGSHRLRERRRRLRGYRRGLQGERPAARRSRSSTSRPWSPRSRCRTTSRA